MRDAYLDASGMSRFVTHLDLPKRTPEALHAALA